MEPEWDISELTLANFPAPLREIPEPPPKLYLQGTLPSADYTYLTIVGSRKYSSYGREVCEKIISELRGQPIVIVSGLALGIDTIAHKAALENNLPTIAMPGSGLDREVLHPHSNRRLADNILSAGGALLSEFAPTYPAGLHTFPRRNRLMAGLAKAVLVIEAGERSGTLITARLGTEYNREVGAVPGSIFNLGSMGTNNLIRQGATPITSGRDVLELLGFAIETEEESIESKGQKYGSLSPTERTIVELLAIEPLTRDQVIIQSGLSVSSATILLTTLEIKGVIKEMMGEIRLI
jgi:DNA processing protein